MSNERGGDYIRRLRKERGMTQEQLARLVGVSQVAISEWERGVVNPSKLSELADALGVDRHEFVKRWAFKEVFENEVVQAIQADPYLERDAKDALLTAYRYMRNPELGPPSAGL